VFLDAGPAAAPSARCGWCSADRPVVAVFEVGDVCHRLTPHPHRGEPLDVVEAAGRWGACEVCEPAVRGRDFVALASEFRLQAVAGGLREVQFVPLDELAAMFEAVDAVLERPAPAS
jgi:hypothetical protein